MYFLVLRLDFFRSFLFTIALLLLQFKSQACTCAWYGSVFCENIYGDHVIVKAVVGDRLDYDKMHGIILENIIDEITDDTITIVGNNGANCGQDLDVFEKGDIVILALTSYNVTDQEMWYLMGECALGYLRYENDEVIGTITSDTVSRQSLMDFKEILNKCLDLRVSTDAVSVEDEIIVVPNPVVDHISIESDSHTLSTVEFFDFNGRLITSKQSPRTNSVQINLNHLTPGLYILKIQTSAASISKRIIKM